jgi:3-oxoacyl-[acyl-carrier-protein] synthase II
MGLDHFYAKVIDELSFTGNDEPRRPKTKKGFLEAFYGRFHRTGYELQTFMTLHHIAKMFNIRGYSLFLNNACASGLFALEAAADTIRSGKCKKMIVSAVDRSSIFKQIWFNRINMCAKDGRIKPFAAGRDGFTLGDGGAALVLEGMEDAVDRKADIYAEYICGSYALEGWKVTYPDVTTDLYKDVILKAVKTAGIDPSDIGLVVPHGVGTTITDGYEAKAISKIFGKKPDRPIISALKPYTGHTLGSTALLETAIMLIGMRENKVPATLNCDNIDSALGINILRETISADVKIAVKTACGFAGFNGAGIFKKV